MVMSGAAGTSSDASEQRKGPQVMYIAPPMAVGSWPAAELTRWNMKVTPSFATADCMAFQATFENGVFTPSLRATAPAPSTNIADTCAPCDEFTIIIEFTEAMAFSGSVPLSGQKAWPLHALSAPASGGVMLTTNGRGATSLVPATGSLQSPTTGEVGVPAAARTLMYIVVSAAAVTRWVRAVVISAVAMSRPSALAATRTW